MKEQKKIVQWWGKVVFMTKLILHRTTLIVLKSVLRPVYVARALGRAVHTYRTNRHLWYFFELKCWWCGEERKLFTVGQQGTNWCATLERKKSHPTASTVLLSIYLYVFELVDREIPEQFRPKK